jgi:hypothetical protein
MIRLNVPTGGPSHIFDRNGAVFQSRLEGDRLVVDVTPAVFRTLIANRQNGLAWERENPEALANLGRP